MHPVREGLADMESVSGWFPVPRRGTMDDVWCPRCGRAELQKFVFSKEWLVCGNCGIIQQQDG